MNTTHKNHMLKALYSFQIMRDNESYIFVRNRIYNCVYNKNNYILFDGKDNRIVTKKEIIDKYFEIIG